MKQLLLFLFLYTALFAADFDQLMGKNTKHWEYLKQPEEMALLQRCRELYDENQGLRFFKTKEAKMPRVVHWIWLGPKSFPRESVENVRTWIGKNPGWKFKFWTDRDRPLPCGGMEKIVLTDYPFPFLKKCYEESDNWGEKSDILRFEILFQEGGVYVDHDANCIKPFDDLHQAYDFYCCLEAPHPPFAERYNLTAGIGVVGSASGHPIIKRVIDKIDAHWDEMAKKFPGQDGYSRTQLVIERTYIVMTYALKELIGKTEKRDIVLPASYFFAKGGMPPLYSKHFYGNTWAGGHGNTAFEKQTRRELGQIDRKTNSLYYFCFAILAFNLALILSGVLFYKKMRSL